MSFILYGGGGFAPIAHSFREASAQFAIALYWRIGHRVRRHGVHKRADDVDAPDVNRKRESDAAEGGANNAVARTIAAADVLACISPTERANEVKNGRDSRSTDPKISTLVDCVSN